MTSFFYNDQCDESIVANDDESLLKSSIGALAQCNSIKLPTVNVSFNK